MTFNADTTTGNYNSASFLYGTSGSDATIVNKLVLTGIAYQNNQSGIVFIEDADKSFPKRISGSNSAAHITTGAWHSTSAITTIALALDAGTMTGTVKLYGIAS